MTDRNLTRVSDKIGDAIVRFFRTRQYETFYATDLLAYVQALFPDIAPDSPGRIMRLLRRRGVIKYVVVNRTASCYEVIDVLPDYR